MGYYPPDNRSTRCDECGKRLTGRQERYCSATCRSEAWRHGHLAAAVGSDRLKPCPLCGDWFEVTSKRKKYCDYYDEAEFECQTAQDDLEEAEDIAAMMRVDAHCIRCDEPAGWKGQGRPRRYCSNRCKQADYRSRRRGAAQAA